PQSHQTPAEAGPYRHQAPTTASAAPRAGGFPAVDCGCATASCSYWRLPYAFWRLTTSLVLAQELQALGEFRVVKRFELLWAWQVTIKNDLIIEAEGTTERIGHRPCIETRYGTAKPRDDFE